MNESFSFSVRNFGYCVKTTCVVTRTALGTPFSDDLVNCLLVSPDSIMGASLLADFTARALVAVDGVFEQGFADPGRATLVSDVCLELVPEIANRAEYRVGETLPQAAEGTIPDRLPQIFEQFDISFLPLTAANPIEDSLKGFRSARYMAAVSKI